MEMKIYRKRASISPGIFREAAGWGTTDISQVVSAYSRPEETSCC